LQLTPGRAASQIYHGTRRKLGFFEKHFPAARRAGNALTIRNPRKSSFATGTGTSAALAILSLLTKKPQKSGICNGNGSYLGRAASYRI